MNRYLIAAALVATLAGCASGVKLDQAPVEDKSAQSAVTAPAPAVAPANQNKVAAVNLDASNADKMGPAGVARVVYFDYDSYVVKPEFQAAIDAHARFLKADKNRKLSLAGHTDERGGREYNLALGQKRAEAVRRALVLLGVADAQIEAVSFGKEKPAASGSDEAAMAKNRRAEFNYR